MTPSQDQGADAPARSPFDQRNEEWRQVPDSVYAVSDLGRLRNMVTGRLLKITPNASGRRKVRLKGLPRRAVGRIVLEAFIGPAPSQEYETSHLNGDQGDDRLSNLLWERHAVNNDNKFFHGTVRHGERTPSAKITADLARQIYQAGIDGISHREIGSRFGLSKSTVGDIVHGRAWWRATGHPKPSIPSSDRLHPLAFPTRFVEELS